MKVFSSQRFLAIYSGVLTVAFIVTILCGFTGAAKRQSFQEIDVQRINVRVPDGTLRMVISNMQSFPGTIIRGKEYPHERKSAGMLFYDNEGTEDGGLIFDAFKDASGKVTEASVHMSFEELLRHPWLSATAGEAGKNGGPIGSARAEGRKWQEPDCDEGGCEWNTFAGVSGCGGPG